MTVPGTRGRTASTSRRKGGRKGAALNRSLIMQGLLLQGLLALLLVGMAFFSLDDPTFLAAYLWSLVIPVGVSATFLRALRRTEALTREQIEAGGERRESKNALSLLGAIFLVWVLGLMVIVFLL